MYASTQIDPKSERPYHNHRADRAETSKLRQVLRDATPDEIRALEDVAWDIERAASIVVYVSMVTILVWSKPDLQDLFHVEDTKIMRFFQENGSMQTSYAWFSIFVTIHWNAQLMRSLCRTAVAVSAMDTTTTDERDLWLGGSVERPPHEYLRPLELRDFVPKGDVIPKDADERIKRLMLDVQGGDRGDHHTLKAVAAFLLDEDDPYGEMEFLNDIQRRGKRYRTLGRIEEPVL